MNFFSNLRNLFLIFRLSNVTGINKLFFTLSIVGALETVGILSVFPFLSLLSGNVEPFIIIVKNLNPIFFDLIPTSRESLLYFIGSATFVFVLLTVILRIFSILYLNVFVEKIRSKISIKILEFYLGQKYSYFLGRDPSELVKNLLSEVDNMIVNVIKPTLDMFCYSLVAIFIVGMLSAVNFAVAIAAFLTMVVLYIFIYFLLKSRIAGVGELYLDANKSRFKVGSIAIAGIKNIKMYDCADLYLKNFSTAASRHQYAISRFHFFHQFPKHLLEAIAFGGVILLTFFLLSKAGSISPLEQVLPILGIYAFSAYRLQPALTSVYQGVTSLRYGSAAIQNILNELQSGTTPQTNDNSLLPLDGNWSSISFENVGYTYPGESRTALKGISVSIRRGGLVGIIGETGSGKSTFLDILLGFLEPDEGQIWIGNDQLLDSNSHYFRRQVGYVPQEVVLSAEGIVENIAFGISVESIDFNAVMECAKVAQIDDLLVDWTDGRLVGDRGSGLSGGQRQRIGIARALYRKPNILVLDEATSALDRKTSKEVIKSILQHHESLTVVLVTHDRELAQQCDKIISLKNGHIEV